MFALFPSGISPHASVQDIGVRPFDPQDSGAIDPAATGAPCSPYDDLDVTFPNLVNRVSFAINANGGNTVDVTALDNGIAVANISFLIVDNFNFLGFKTDAPFDRILIEVGNVIDSVFWRIDNLRYELDLVPDADDDGVPDDADNCPPNANFDRTHGGLFRLEAAQAGMPGTLVYEFGNEWQATRVDR